MRRQGGARPPKLRMNAVAITKRDLDLDHDFKTRDGRPLHTKRPRLAFAHGSRFACCVALAPNCPLNQRASVDSTVRRLRRGRGRVRPFRPPLRSLPPGAIYGTGCRMPERGTTGTL